MANILTDPSPTYAAADVFQGTKTNSTPRLPTESDVYVTAQWGIEIDAGVHRVNEWYQGNSVAGASGKNAQLLGGFQVAENAAFAGAIVGDVSGTGIAVGSTSVANNGFQLQAQTKSTYYFSSPTQVAAGALDYDHGVNSLTLRAANTDIAELTSSGLFPKSHNVFNLGSASKRWSDFYADTITVNSSAKFGADAQIEVELLGGNVGGQEPAIVFKQTSVEAARFQVEASGALKFTGSEFDLADATDGLGIPQKTTAERTALVHKKGKTVFDTDEDALYWSDGVSWSTPAAAFLSGLTDTDITSPTHSQILTYNQASGNWENTDQGNALIRNAICTASESAGDIVYIFDDELGGDIQVRQVDITDITKAIGWGVITNKPTPTTATVQANGEIDGVSIGITGLDFGKPVYIDASGRPTTTYPAPGVGITHHIQPIGIAHDANKFVLNPNARLEIITG